MPVLRDKKEIAKLARALAFGYRLVEYKSGVYMPVHFMTREFDPSLTPEQTVWIPLSEKKLKRMGNIISGILFYTDSEVRSYIGMIKQFATPVYDEVTTLLVRVGEEKVMRLTSKGTLKDVTGDFAPNYLDVPYDVDSPLADQLFATIAEWVGSEEQAHSLLYHLATALQPGWSAVKYVLLIGSGRNGKSTLLLMFKALLGKDNLSGVTRQLMARDSVTMMSMNGKLANVVMDGPKEFIKESSTEKTLIAGEPLMIELKFENAPAEVQTNALFIEGLQQEPRTSDKSPALQKRLVRFHFPNTYPLDKNFEARMLKEKMLAALLALLLRHWVTKKDAADLLAPTAESVDLQMEAVWNISPLLRFLEHISSRDDKFLSTIMTSMMRTEVFISTFREWLENNGYKNMEDTYIVTMLKDHFVLDRKTFRAVGGTRQFIKDVLPDTANAIQTLLQGGKLDHDQTDIDVLEGEQDDAVV